MEAAILVAATAIIIIPHVASFLLTAAGVALGVYWATGKLRRWVDQDMDRNLDL